MTHAEIHKFIGTTRFLRCDGGLLVPVVIRDYALAWGRDRWRVEPVGGFGSRWVDADSLEDELPLPSSAMLASQC